ncbi:hypothetical protein CIP107503_00090 [Corynebacterium diphtheriae]|nr:hypothetical protein CIP107503_00090 [Corynebacterium diphtheriae]SNW31016.1 hypothetical protein FRC0043_00695 [Corynebacterium belfantii]CAB0534238.1 hypothetical protein CIP107528_00220 [Corynebacterium diphtheriae]CAB0578384.1 hypothetical protein CIP107541_00091 [Corynebacterium diphtheriae]CAB1027817.1 hypothetical protein NCTC10648_00090 [Corynebacterium diphtheriae]
MTMRTYKNPYPDSEDAVEIRTVLAYHSHD